MSRRVIRVFVLMCHRQKFYIYYISFLLSASPASYVLLYVIELHVQAYVERHLTQIKRTNIQSQTVSFI
jgi:hypothetical protein